MEDSSSSDLENEEFYRILERKKKKLQLQKQEMERNNPNKKSLKQIAAIRDNRERQRSRSRDNEKKIPLEIRWHLYEKCPEMVLKSRIHDKFLALPIFHKKEQILNGITHNQFLLITGQTGCGKSTQVPRLIYEYLRIMNNKESKIMCVQPRRLAVLNLKNILDQQMPQRNQIGYQIGMESKIYPENRIVFVTNGIFLQRLIHSTEFFEQFPFIILDEVHERDIDTDFILLTIKRIIRKFPKVRVILMSATIDNQLFRYYFAADHIDSLGTQENYYVRILAELDRIKGRNKMQEGEENQNEIVIDSDEEDKIYEKYELEFKKAKYPCPAVNVTDQGKYSREYFYLDKIDRFLGREYNKKWGSVIFCQKYPNTHKELYETVCLLLEEIERKHRNDRRKMAALIFMPGLAEIQNLNEAIVSYFRSDKINQIFQILLVHSTILNEVTTRKLQGEPADRFRIIIATNIAESSITVLGVQYVIDFCLSKQVRFDLKSKMESLELVWASHASCDQRAGRTGRVCNGVIFRLVQESFYKKLPAYSTPQIQRSSLDKLILRIKLLNEGEVDTKIFKDPGQVLGSAIQPPHLKNIDTAIRSLQFCGGLVCKDDHFDLTNLGRFYIDIPIDIVYCKLLLISQLFGTFEEMLILVGILSQNKNAVRRGNIDRQYMDYYNNMDNSNSCDFRGLLRLYQNSRKRNSRGISLDTYKETQLLVGDVQERLHRKKAIRQPSSNFTNEYYLEMAKLHLTDGYTEYDFRFKMTLLCGFIQNILKVMDPLYEEKQEKRIKLMKRLNINHRNTVCLLGSDVLKKPDTIEQEEKLKQTWRKHVYQSMGIHADFTLTNGLSYMHFHNEADLHKFLFIKNCEESKRSVDYFPKEESKNFVTVTEIFKHFGEMDHMQVGRPVTYNKSQIVSVDSYSLNRVVNKNEGQSQKFLISNNIAKQSSRMVARYTSLLPNFKFLDIVGHLLFHPFVHLIPNQQRTRYQYISLYKAKKNKIRFSSKHQKMLIPYNLTEKQIKKINEVRKLIKKFLSMENGDSTDYTHFNSMVLNIVAMQRHHVVEQQNWQQAYLRFLFSSQPHKQKDYLEFLSSRLEIEAVNTQEDKQFMNGIQCPPLKINYFSDVQIGGQTCASRRVAYQIWKQKKIREVQKMNKKATDTDTYLACGQCQVQLAPMVKIGNIHNDIYRQLFSYISQHVKQMPVNQMDNHFCTMLLHNNIDPNHRVYGCQNGHYFGIRFDGEKFLKILPFSQLLIIYPDGMVDKFDFENVDMRRWKKTQNQCLRRRHGIEIDITCFVCDQNFRYLKDLEGHVKEARHIENFEQLKKTVKIEDQSIPMEVQFT